MVTKKEKGGPRKEAPLLFAAGLLPARRGCRPYPLYSIGCWTRGLTPGLTGQSLSSFPVFMGLVFVELEIAFYVRFWNIQHCVGIGAWVVSFTDPAIEPGII